jgi:hypothetical protein
MQNPHWSPTTDIQQPLFLQQKQSVSKTGHKKREMTSYVFWTRVHIFKTTDDQWQHFWVVKLSSPFFFFTYGVFMLVALKSLSPCRHFEIACDVAVLVFRPISARGDVISLRFVPACLWWPDTVFLEQGSTEHRYGCREKYWNKYITVLKYRKKL